MQPEGYGAIFQRPGCWALMPSQNKIQGGQKKRERTKDTPENSSCNHTWTVLFHIEELVVTLMTVL